MVVAVISACGTSPRTVPVSPAASDGGQRAIADTLRALERKRVRALVNADTAVARTLHAPDFQLINPSGGAVSRSQYFDNLASGRFHYAAWEPESISVRVYDGAAVLRYRSRLVFLIKGPAGTDTVKPFGYWHTDLYEKRPDGWQAVWSQATRIAESTTVARPPSNQR